MGHIRIDKRGDQVKVVFYVGNGKKDIPQKSVLCADAQFETLLAVIEPVLAELRAAQTPSGTVQ